MRIGVPAEVKNHEYRVALTPAGAHELAAHGHDVHVQRGAGVGSSIADEEYLAAGAKIVDSADESWDLRARAQGQGARGAGVPPHAGGPDPLHLPPPRRRAPPSRRCSPGGLRRLRDRVRPRTARCRSSRPCREVAGRLAPQVGAHTLMKAQRRARRADGWRARRAPGQGRRDRRRRLPATNAATHRRRHGRRRHPAGPRLEKLRAARPPLRPKLRTLASTSLSLEQAVLEADLVIGAVLVPGAKAPTLVTNELLSRDEALLGAGGHLHRPERLLLVLSRLPLTPTLRTPCSSSFFYCGKDAGCRRSHLYARVDQRDPVLRRVAGLPRLCRGPAR